jgi:hypothetical protein
MSLPRPRFDVRPVHIGSVVGTVAVGQIFILIIRVSLSVSFWESFLITRLDRRLGLQEVQDPRISRQSAHEGGKVVSLRQRPLLPSGDILGTH